MRRLTIATGHPSDKRERRHWGVAAAWCTLAAAILTGSGASAGQLTARQVTERLFKATPGAPADLAAQDLRGLDLSGLAFKRARLKGSDLTGVDLTGSDLAGTDLEGASLDRATVSRSDFSGANLEGARLRMMAVSNGLDPIAADAPRFAGANLRQAEIEARLDFADFHGADLSHAKIGRQLALWGSYKPRSVMIGCDFSGARLVGASFEKSVLRFAKFAGADLTGADLRESDLSGADLTGADLTGARLGGVDLDGAILTGAKGLDKAEGLASALNLERAVR